VAPEEQTIMPTIWHWLTALGEVYARHAERHGPNRLLPAAVLPPHGRVPEPAGPSPQGTGPDRRTAESFTPQACTHIPLDGYLAVDRDRLREEIHHLETSLHYWQARWHHTPGPSDPGTPRHRIQHTIDLLQQELDLKRGLDPR